MNIHRIIKNSLITALLGGVSVCAQGQIVNRSGPLVINELKHDVSPAVSSLPLASRTLTLPPSEEREREDIITIPQITVPESPDPVVQPAANTPNAAVVGLNFDGMAEGASVCNCAPPDTNGAAGLTQYVQITNSAFTVFNKTTGAVISGPHFINSLWAGFGGVCQNDNNGDPIVNFDRIANRWVISQFALTGGFAQCIAVSQSADATGVFNRYAFPYSTFPDYPKVGVWRDAYYVTYNNFNAAGTTFLGANVCAVDSAKMQAGLAATQQCFPGTLNTGLQSLLPADIDGTTLPAAGAPEFVMSLANTTTASILRLWKFHVDFAIPANSTFTLQPDIAVPTYTKACSGGGACISQPGVADKLGSLADRQMYRLVWTMAAGRERLLASHSVGTATSSNVRWYEIRTPSTTPTVFQASTFAPDAKFRWMGSVAMDKMGNLAIGYSLSDGVAQFPSVAIAVRQATEPRNFL